MRYLILLLAACEPASSAPPARMPETVVVFDDLVDTKLLETRPRETPQPFVSGCDIVAPTARQDPKPGDVIVRCLERELFLRFNCRGVTAEYPLSFVARGDAFRLYCK